MLAANTQQQPQTSTTAPSPPTPPPPTPPPTLTYLAASGSDGTRRRRQTKGGCSDRYSRMGVAESLPPPPLPAVVNCSGGSGGICDALRGAVEQERCGGGGPARPCCAPGAVAAVGQAGDETDRPCAPSRARWSSSVLVLVLALPASDQVTCRPHHHLQTTTGPGPVSAGTLTAAQTTGNNTCNHGIATPLLLPFFLCCSPSNL